MGFPAFNSGDIFYASDANAIGLWLIKTQTVGSAVSSVEVTGAFSANYEAYKIIWTGGTGSGNLDLRLTLGATATGYYYSAVYSPWNNTPTAVGTSTGTFFLYAGAAGTTYGQANFELRNPFETTRTGFNSQVHNFAAGINCVGYLDNATSYTAFTLTCSAGTISGGTIRVYGYKE